MIDGVTDHTYLEGAPVSGPLTFVTTHTINDGKLADYMRQHSEFITFLETNEPRLLDFRAYMNEEQTEVTFLFVFPDAEAAAAMGANLMDPALVGPAIEAGERQGRRVAADLAPFWTS